VGHVGVVSIENVRVVYSHLKTLRPHHPTYGQDATGQETTRLTRIASTPNFALNSEQGSYSKSVDALLVIVDKEKFGNQMMVFKATRKRKTFSYISRDSSP
jgi:hypothetical protein